jgi:hypothetical protein
MQVDDGQTFGDFNGAFKVIARILGKSEHIGHVLLV